ncbi:hypothetical protein [Lichenicoccus sp.]|uniref:hypothetical protein n=1 Tax=Lichenicoccus sp. TaxID=2781899 RepID=UPI003D128886
MRLPWSPARHFPRLSARIAPSAPPRAIAAPPALHIASPEALGERVFGPAVFAFLAWLIRHPATARLDRLYFASREGWALERLYGAMRARLADNALPRGLYLPCSRRVMLAAQLGAAQLGATQREAPLANGRLEVGLLTASSPWFEGTVEDLLLARIGFVPKRPAPPDTTRITLMQDAAIAHCAAELMADEIVPHVRRIHADVLAFAASCGLTAGGAAGLVDVGYSATIQTAIQHTLGVRLAGFYMAVSDAAAKAEAGRAGGYAFAAFARGAATATFAAECGLPLEAVLSAPHGQVIGYAPPTRGRRAAPVSPVFGAPGLAQLHFPMLQRVHDGMHVYCLDRLSAHGLQAAPDPLAMLRRLGRGEVSVAPEIGSALMVEDAFCGNGEIDVLARARGAQ